MSPTSRPDPDARHLPEFLLSDIVRISADAIICIDSEQRITLFNDGAEQIFGWTKEEIMGQPLDVLLPDRVRSVHRAHVERFGRSKEHSRKMGERSEISGVRKNGEEFPAEAAISRVQSGDSVVYSVVLRDITEQVELHKRLQRAISARDETVGMVAHDLRNPVSAVKMLAQALLASGSVPEGPQREQLALIRDASLQMDHLIQDLLDITRVEMGRLVVNPQPLTTLALLEGALGTLRPLVESAGIRLAVDIPAVLPRVDADPERIGQVLSNLVGNSIKFTAPGGVVSVRAAERGDEVVISVGDTGTGIAEEQLTHIFDRYWQGSTSTIRSRGAGLGLPIARGIVIAHGGRMWAESKVGSGSTFHFSLPVAE